MAIQSDIDLCNRALLAIGAKPIQTFDDGTLESQCCKLLYPAERDAQLVAHPWWFAEKEADLSRLSTTRSYEYEYSYLLPADLLHVRYVVRDTSTGARCDAYKLMGDALCTDIASVRLVYTCRAAEQVFPPLFQTALVDWLSVRLVIPITEDLNRAGVLGQLAQASLQRARLADSQSDTPKTIDTSTLIGVR